MPLLEIYNQISRPGARFRVTRDFTVTEDDSPQEVLAAGDYETEYVDEDGECLFWELVGGRRGVHNWDPSSYDVYSACEAGVIQVLP